jgi:hypothetical protein
MTLSTFSGLELLEAEGPAFGSTKELIFLVFQARQIVPVNLRPQMLPNCSRMISKVMQLNFSCYPKCGIKLPSLNSHSGTLIFEWAFKKSYFYQF